METLVTTFTTTGTIHHAYVLEGERETTRATLLDFIKNTLGHDIQGNPDFWHERYESFTIEDARNLRDIQALKALSGERKIFVIELFSITVEAQNSLLKVFEEPTAGTHFFILTPTSEIFLPTLKSRVVVIKNIREKESTMFATEFLIGSIPERLKIVADITEDKDKGKAVDLINQLIFKLHTKSDSFVMGELLKVRGYLSDRSPSLKLLLEHIALILPKV